MVLKERIHKHIPILELCTYCSMNKQYVEGVQNGTWLDMSLKSSKLT